MVLRLERAFGVRLSIKLVSEANSVGDLLQALEQAGQTGATIAAAPASPLLGAVSAAAEASTLLEVLEWHVAHDPDRLHLAVLEDDSTIVGTLSYGELAKQSRSVAAGLVERDIMPGDRVALMLPTSLGFFTTFFGVLYAGGIPVPIYPPMQRSQIEDYARRQAGILRNAGVRLLITVPEAIRLGALLKGLVPSLSSIESAMTLSGLSADIPLPNSATGPPPRLFNTHPGARAIQKVSC